jgi:hypothetical protein
MMRDPREALMLAFCEIAREKRPRWVIWENVSGVLSSHKEGTLAPSSGRWGNAGTDSPAGFLTIDTTEFPKDAEECLLSDIMETIVPSEYFLTARTARGMLRSAKKRLSLSPSLLRSLRISICFLGRSSSDSARDSKQDF